MKIRFLVINDILTFYFWFGIQDSDSVFEHRIGSLALIHTIIAGYPVFVNHFIRKVKQIAWKSDFWSYFNRLFMYITNWFLIRFWIINAFIAGIPTGRYIADSMKIRFLVFNDILTFYSLLGIPESDSGLSLL